MSNVVEIDGEKFHIVKSEEEINETPAAVVNDDVALEALMFQIASTPSIVIKDEPVFIGEVPTKENLLEKLKNVQ